MHMQVSKNFSNKQPLKKLSNLSVKYKNHLFPFAILLVFILLVCFRISGTSIGVYSDYFYGKGASDPALLYGKPQSIRSDEWLVSTQLTIAQSSNGYKAINTNFAEPKDLALITDVPSLDWSTIFRPQNIVFFLVPIEFAFAFKWWLLLFSLVISSYYFALKLTKDKVAISVLFSILISFAPFIFWWYQTATIAPLTYGFIIMLISMSVIDKASWSFINKKIREPYLDILKTALLTYALISFALILYPPFLVPVAIVVAAFVIGYALNQRLSITRHHLMRILLIFLSAVIITVAVGVTFVATHSQEIHNVMNTAYPGKRDVKSGGYDINRLLVTYLQPQLQRGNLGTQYIENQSESSNFIVLPIFFILPAIAVLVRLWLKTKKIDWIIVSLLICCVIFASHLFLPCSTPLTKLLLLNTVPQSRLLIGLGLLGALLTLYIGLILSRETKNKKTLIVLSIYTLFYYIVLLLAGLVVIDKYPEFISNKVFLLVLAAVPSLGLYFVLLGKLRIGLAVLVLFSVASIFQIQPLYVGLGPIYNSRLNKMIDSISSKSSTWGVAEDIYLENVPQMSDRKAITGVNPYPSLSFWKVYSPEETIYNRYAHIFLTSNDVSPLTLIQPDLFTVSLSCNRPINQKIDYIISTSVLNGNCDKLIDTVTYPAKTFYFYKVDH